MNIKRLFLHRYGSSYSFDGYLSKYYSRNPYQYDNVKAIDVIAKEVTFYGGKQIDSTIGTALRLIISDLIHAEEITLRDLLKLQKQDFYKTLSKQEAYYCHSLQNYRSKYMYLNIIAFLNHIYDSETILLKFKRCRHRAVKRQNFNYTYYTSIGFIPFITGSLDPIVPYNYTFNNISYTFKITYCREYSLTNYDYYHTEDLSRNDTGKPAELSAKDFYDVLILNTEKYTEG